MSRFMLHLANIGKQLPLSTSSDVVEFVSDWLMPIYGLINEKVTIKRLNVVRHEVGDKVRVIKPTSEYYGQIGTVTFVNRRSNTPYLIKIGKETLGCKSWDIELYDSRNSNLKLIIVDKRNDKSSRKFDLIELIMPDRGIRVIYYYDDLKYMTEDIADMIADEKVDEINIWIGGKRDAKTYTC